MQIQVKYKNAQYKLVDDRFVCTHINAVVEPGENWFNDRWDLSVWCEDCRNKDMTVEDFEEKVDDYIASKEAE